jgi:hypothetical protein
MTQGLREALIDLGLAAEFKASICKGLDVSRRETFAYWAKLWISSQRNNVSANWLKSQKHMIEQLNRTIGFMEITKIRASGKRKSPAAFAVTGLFCIFEGAFTRLRFRRLTAQLKKRLGNTGYSLKNPLIKIFSKFFYFPS